ncbi:hypothetical protein [Paraburkholderia metrosideri]|uniref:hypothetical protein n=1 Tax=Paraburkholderia metrosideri TaxID=580937 RepID=UPI00191898DD|nr:hypothetical protein [Paraburkholderia metrosideri]
MTISLNMLCKSFLVEAIDVMAHLRQKDEVGESSIRMTMFCEENELRISARDARAVRATRPSPAWVLPLPGGLPELELETGVINELRAPSRGVNDVWSNAIHRP